MGWMLEAAGLSAAGLRGIVRAKALVGVWLYALRAWKDDESADLAGTMAALDKALDQAERLFGVLAPADGRGADDGMEGRAGDADCRPLAAQPPPRVPEPPASPGYHVASDRPGRAAAR